MKNDLVIALHKEKAYATAQQQGHTSKWLDCIDNIQEFCRMIRLRVDNLQIFIDRTQQFDKPIDHTARCIEHGIYKNKSKSINDALTDVYDKLIKFREKKYNQYVVNWSEGEISMLNAMVDIVNNWSKQNKFAYRFPRVIIKRHYDDARPPEYVDISGTTITNNVAVGKREVYTLPASEPVFKKVEQYEEYFTIWDCELYTADSSRHRS